jgi:uncharacterized membrane protein
VIRVAVLFFLVIFASLGFALFYFRKGDRPQRFLNALTVRVALSVLFFILLLLAWYAGLIEPHGLGG